MRTTLEELSRLVNGSVIGDGSTVITAVSDLENGEPGSIAFLANARYKKFLSSTRASAVIVSREITEAQTNLLQVDDPYLAFRTVLVHFNPFPEVKKTVIHPTAHIDKNAHIGDRVHIGAFTVIGAHAIIGDNCIIREHAFIGEKARIGSHTLIHPGVKVLDTCEIGSYVIIHSGAVIGSDGFGYAKKDGRYLKIPQVGNVVIHNHVEIGANCTIDRATLGSTVIEKGCIIDNLVQIAHNVVVKENTAIAAQTGIAGSTKIGKGVIMGGQVGIVGHIEIGDYAILGAQSGVTKSVPEKSFYFGYPARNHTIVKKTEAYLKKLPDLFNRVKLLESFIKKSDS